MEARRWADESPAMGRRKRGSRTRTRSSSAWLISASESSACDGAAGGSISSACNPTANAFGSARAHLHAPSDIRGIQGTFQMARCVVLYVVAAHRRHAMRCARPVRTDGAGRRRFSIYSRCCGRSMHERVFVRIRVFGRTRMHATHARAHGTRASAGTNAGVFGACIDR